jgi:hypothetical protein
MARIADFVIRNGIYYFFPLAPLACGGVRYIHNIYISTLREMVNTQNNRFVTFIDKEIIYVYSRTPLA